MTQLHLITEAYLIISISPWTWHTVSAYFICNRHKWFGIDKYTDDIYTDDFQMILDVIIIFNITIQIYVYVYVYIVWMYAYLFFQSSQRVLMHKPVSERQV